MGTKAGKEKNPILPNLDHRLCAPRDIFTFLSYRVFFQTCNRIKNFSANYFPQINRFSFPNPYRHSRLYHESQPCCSCVLAYIRPLIQGTSISSSEMPTSMARENGGYARSPLRRLSSSPVVCLSIQIDFALFLLLRRSRKGGPTDGLMRDGSADCNPLIQTADYEYQMSEGEVWWRSTTGYKTDTFPQLK